MLFADLTDLLNIRFGVPPYLNRQKVWTFLIIYPQRKRISFKVRWVAIHKIGGKLPLKSTKSKLIKQTVIR